MPYVPRALAGTIRRAMRTFPAVLVTGPRQTGKTTLLRAALGDSPRYVSLERPDVRDVARDDPVGFLADAGERVILDEIQYAPELLHYIKDDIDARRKPGRWLLTGSQDFALMRGVSQTLAGRIAVLHLDPLAVSEVLGAAAPTSLGDLLEGLCTDPGNDVPEFDLADWLHRGAWPEPRLHPEVDRDLWMQSYVQTYLERDLRNMERVSDLETFRAFFSLVCASTGQVLNLARLGRDAGVSAPTARRWLNLLVTSRLVVLLPPYHRNFGKRIRKSPKLHVIDPGLASWMLGYRTTDAIMNG
ncbi:MAG: ATP-binding protein, partial [Acidobacteria bacterium]|nr:ATP-binding protein [Acidobacteriota bacterium]